MANRDIDKMSDLEAFRAFISFSCGYFGVYQPDDMEHCILSFIRSNEERLSGDQKLHLEGEADKLYNYT